MAEVCTSCGRLMEGCGQCNSRCEPLLAATRLLFTNDNWVCLIPDDLLESVGYASNPLTFELLYTQLFPLLVDARVKNT